MYSLLKFGNAFFFFFFHIPTWKLSGKILNETHSRSFISLKNDSISFNYYLICSFLKLRISLVHFFFPITDICLLLWIIIHFQLWLYVHRICNIFHVSGWRWSFKIGTLQGQNLRSWTSNWKRSSTGVQHHEHLPLDFPR